MTVRITRAAERDLQEIGDWIARDNPDAAARFTAELEGKARQIAVMPFAFPYVTGVKQPSLRKRSHRRYIIFYRVGRTTISIVRILRSSREYTTLFRNS